MAIFQYRKVMEIHLKQTKSRNVNSHYTVLSQESFFTYKTNFILLQLTLLSCTTFERRLTWILEFLSEGIFNSTNSLNENFKHSYWKKDRNLFSFIISYEFSITCAVSKGHRIESIRHVIQIFIYIIKWFITSDFIWLGYNGWIINGDSKNNVVWYPSGDKMYSNPNVAIKENPYTKYTHKG